MRSARSSGRVLRAAASVIVLGLLSAVAADAAPLLRRVAVHARVCDARTLTIDKLRRQVKSSGSPLKRLMKRAFAVGDTTPRLLNRTRTQVPDEDAVIQNDAPAAHLDAVAIPPPGLQPAGVLAGSHDQRPRSRAFSPRSPRGPPFRA